MILNIFGKLYASTKQVEQLKKTKVKFDANKITWSQAKWALGEIRIAKKKINEKKESFREEKKTRYNTVFKKLKSLGIEYGDNLTREEVQHLLDKKYRYPKIK